METKPFEVGDAVAVMTPGDFYSKWSGLPRWLTVVKRVAARFIELEDGSRWNHRGDPYPKRDGYNVPYLEHATDLHRARMRQYNTWRRIEKMLEKIVGKPYEISSDRLVALHDMLVQWGYGPQSEAAAPAVQAQVHPVPDDEPCKNCGGVTHSGGECPLCRRKHESET